MRLVIKEIAGSEILAKAATGRSMLNRLLSQAEIEPMHAEPAFLDFAGVNVATASFLRECVIGFRNSLRFRKSRFYLVLINMNEAVCEELHDLLSERSDAMLTCSFNHHDGVKRLDLIGRLDPKHHQTFNWLMEAGGSDATSLLKTFGEKEGITRTAWNNRLSALAEMGLVIEETYGRAKRYVPVMRES